MADYQGYRYAKVLTETHPERGIYCPPCTALVHLSVITFVQPLMNIIHPVTLKMGLRSPKPDVILGYPTYMSATAKTGSCSTDVLI